MPAEDPQYSTFVEPFVSRGVVAKYASDVAPEGSYLTMNGMQERQENALSTVWGRQSLFVDPNTFASHPLPDLNVHTIARLKSLGAAYLYAGAGTNLYRRADTDAPGMSLLQANLSGNRFGVVSYRPDFSSVPYQFIADAGLMMKDNGTFTPSNWGMLPPLAPPLLTLRSPIAGIIDLGDVTTGWTFTNFTGTSNPSRISGTIASSVGTGIQVVTPSSMTNVLPGCLITHDSGNGAQETVVVLSTTATTYTADFTIPHNAGSGYVGSYLSGSVAAGVTAILRKATPPNNLGGFGDDDTINIFLNVSNPAGLQEIRLMFDVGDGTFTQDYYYKSIAPTSFQSTVSTLETAASATQRRVFNRASGMSDVRRFGVIREDLMPDDDVVLPQLRQAELRPGLGVWTLITAKLSEFLPVGRAGDPGKSWANVTGYQVTIQAGDTLGCTVGIDDIYASGGAGPDSFAGVGYDYRVTAFNNNTGAESNPTQTIIEANWLFPRRQPVKVDWSAAASCNTDAQITHWRVYRRGGTLPTGWKRVAQVAVGTTTFTDTLADELVAGNTELEIDNDPPVTSTLRTPVDTTLTASVPAAQFKTVGDSFGYVGIANGTNIQVGQYVTIDQGQTSEETVLLLPGTSAGSIRAFFQYAHSSGATVKAQTRPARALPLAALAFDQVWLAGDPDNPHILYYSKKYRPESFSPANNIEIGTPSEPIMAVREYRGQLYVFTTARVYQVLGIGTTVPLSFKTATRHGLVSSWAICEIEGVLIYESWDGIYAFTGSGSQLVSDEIRALFPTESNPEGIDLGFIKPVNLAQRSQSIMAFAQNSVVWTYIDKTGARQTMRYSVQNKRWRDDSSFDVRSLCFIEDTGRLYIGGSDGMVYQDGTGDVDIISGNGSAFVTRTIPFTVQTPYNDNKLPKNPKVYNEFTLDLDTHGQNVNVSLLFDNGATTLSLGTFNSNGRAQINRNLNSGLGQLAKNVSIKVSGAVTKAVTLWKGMLRATVEAELRQSYDSYWMRFETDSYKLLKQSYWEYTAPGGPVTVTCYIDGDSTTPEFTFTLPQATKRTAFMQRHPATKAKEFRFVGTCASDFSLYPTSGWDIKPVTSGKGYVTVNLEP